MEILNEIKVLEQSKILEESKKKATKAIKDKIKKRFEDRSDKAEKIATKLRARKGSINWADDDIKEVRNTIVSAFMANDSKTVIDLMQEPNEGYKVIEILKALEVAHGGYDKLLAASGKAGKKDFIKTVFAYIDENESEEETEDSKK